MDAAKLQRGRQRGLTLLEVMVALVVLGVALAVVLPEASSWLRSLGVRNTGEAMRAGLERARLEALKRNTTMSFWLVTDSGKGLTNGCTVSDKGLSWVVSGASPASHCADSPSQTEAPMLVEAWAGSEAGSGVVVTGLAANGSAASSVTFNSLGQVQATGTQIARIDISSGSEGVRALRLTVEPGGSVRLCDPNVASNDPRRC